MSKIRAFLSRFRVLLPEKQSLLGGSAISFGFIVAGYGLKYLFALFVTRNYGASSMGAFSIAFTVILIAVSIGRMGVDQTLLRYVSGYVKTKDVDQIFPVVRIGYRIAIFSGITLSLILFYCSDWLASSVFHIRAMSDTFRWSSAAILPFVIIWLNSESLRAVEHFRPYLFLQYLSIFLLACLGLLVLGPFSPGIYLKPIMAFVSGVFATAVISLLLLKKFVLDKYPSVKTKPEVSTGHFLRTSYPMMIAGSIVLLMGWIDVLMLGMFRPVSEVGVYSIVMKVATLGVMPAWAVNTIVVPKIAQLFQSGDRSGLRHFLMKSTRLFVWVSFPGFLVLMIAGIPILRMFGPEFPSGITALRILLVAQFIPALTGSIGNILKMTDLQDNLQQYMLAAVIMNVGLNLLLIPRFGIEGAAIASVVATILWNLMSVRKFWKKFGYSTLISPWRLENR